MHYSGFLEKSSPKFAGLMGEIATQGASGSDLADQAKLEPGIEGRALLGRARGFPDLINIRARRIGNGRSEVSGQTKKKGRERGGIRERSRGVDLQGGTSLESLAVVVDGFDPSKSRPRWNRSLPVLSQSPAPSLPVSHRPASECQPPQGQNRPDSTLEGKLLSAEEERRYAEAIRQGDSDARSRMILANLRLVARIAQNYRGRGLDLEDLIGEGYLGLIRAVEGFDPSFGARFSTYAAYWIRQSIRVALVDTVAPIRLPSHMARRLDQWRQTERSLLEKLGREPTFEETADALALSESRRGLVALALRSRRFLRQSSSGEDENAWSVDRLSSPTEPPGSRLEVLEEYQDVLDRLEFLDDRERLVVVLRFGLGEEEPKSLKEIGQRLGLTHEWVRRIEQRALRKLEKPSLASRSRRRSIQADRSALLVG